MPLQEQDFLERPEWALDFLGDLEQSQANIYLPTILFNPTETIEALRRIKTKLDEVVC